VAKRVSRLGQKESAETVTAGFVRTLAAEVKVRYEDDDLAVVSKPAGLLTHSAPGPDRETLVDALSGRMNLATASGAGREGIVHRLDRDTSGLLAIAKSDEAYRGLIDSMKRRKIRRRYRALVVGSFRLPTGRVEAPIARSTKNPTLMAVTPGGRPAATDFQVLEALRRVTYLGVQLETGRTHQIRVHFAHIGHPIVGDPLYGRSTEGLARALELNRPFLHAAHISFEHPLKNEVVEVEEPLPEELELALRRARQESRTRV
jgi:23S rRNA pseudouridine1911/1915/1917 synthase